MSYRARRRGQAMVEFAVGLILLLTVFCGIFEFSWVFYNYAYLNNVVSKAARLAVPTANTGSNGDDAIRAFVANAKGGLPIAPPTIQLTDVNGNATASRTAGNILKVTAAMSYSSITPLSSFVEMSSFATLRASCSVILE